MSADALPVLAFPAYAFEVRERAGRRWVLDPVRRQWVRLTPEEWVRQHVLRYLLDRGYPRGLLAVEKGFTYLGAPARADVVAYDAQQRARLMVECKAPDVPLTAAVFDQATRYNQVLQAPVLLLTNGLQHLIWERPTAGTAGGFLDDVPVFG